MPHHFLALVRISFHHNYTSRFSIVRYVTREIKVMRLLHAPSERGIVAVSLEFSQRNVKLSYMEHFAMRRAGRSLSANISHTNLFGNHRIVTQPKKVRNYPCTQLWKLRSALQRHHFPCKKCSLELLPCSWDGTFCLCSC